jgi:GntR family transcriptional regulator/MocR family aminotransferase
MSPRTASSAPSVLARLDPARGVALHRQLYDSLRDAIVRGRLAPRTRVPGARTLAAELGVARNTAASALAQLQAEGYVEARERSGTFVCSILPDAALAPPRPSSASSVRAMPDGAPTVATPAPTLSQRGRAATAYATSPGDREPSRPRAFRVGVPALDAFPWPLWTRLTSRRLRASAAALADYGMAAGYAPLRAAIAAHVGAARGVACSAEQVVVTNGAQQALELAARLLLDPGEAVWMEEPGYLGARAAFASAGARLVPVPLDDEGIDVAEGTRRAPSARLAYVTPSHQYPTGVTMSATRRLALLRWARDAGAWIVEDDYDSEYRYASRPLASLQGLATDVGDGGRVLYVGTFSKTLFPGLRLGYLVVPTALVDAFARARGVSGRHASGVEQAVLTDFLDGGHHARHVRRMRVLYEERRDVLLRGLAEQVGGVLEPMASDAGMHLVAYLPADRPADEDRTLVAHAQAAGIELRALTAYALGPLPRGGLLLGFAACRPSEIRAGCRRLGAVLRAGGQG